jgi:hypothetical protein
VPVLRDGAVSRLFAVLLSLLCCAWAAPAAAQQIPIIFGSNAKQTIQPHWNTLGMMASSQANGATFTKTAGSGSYINAYVSTGVALHGNGSVSWTTHTGSIVVGLAKSVSGLPGSGYIGIDFSMYQEPGDGVLDVIELGTPVFGGVPGTYAPGDMFTVKVTGTTVTYLHNSVLFYTSAVPATFPLYVTGVANNNAAAIEQLTIAGAWH